MSLLSSSWQSPVGLDQIEYPEFIDFFGLSYNRFRAGAYEQQFDKGAFYQSAVRALACKWIRIVFRCWQNGT
jgi:hypothetical protein